MTSCFHDPDLASACADCRGFPYTGRSWYFRAVVWVFDWISDKFLLTGPKDLW